MICAPPGLSNRVEGPAEKPVKLRRPMGIRMISNFVDNVCELAVFAPALKATAAKVPAAELNSETETALSMAFTVQAANTLPSPAEPPAIVMPGGGKLKKWENIDGELHQRASEENQGSRKSSHES